MHKKVGLQIRKLPIFYLYCSCLCQSLRIVFIEVFIISTWFQYQFVKNDLFLATYVKIQRNEENVGGAYRRHEGEGDEMHASAEVRRFKSLHTQIESCLSILRAHCTVWHTGCGVFKGGIQN